MDYTFVCNGLHFCKERNGLHLKKKGHMASRHLLGLGKSYTLIGWGLLDKLTDEHHKAFKDPLYVPVGPITKVRSKKIKEALNGLIQEIWANSNTGHSKLGPKEDEGVINLIKTIEG